jgi:hypothetical protein
VHVFAEVAEARAVVFQRHVAPAGAVVEDQRVVGRFAAGVGHHGAAVQVLKLGHPQPDAELARQPARQAHVIGVHVGDQHAGHAALIGRLGKQRAPDLHGFVGACTGVHQGPAFAIVHVPTG